MSTKRDDERLLGLIVNALDDATEQASDEEILQDAKLAGIDTAAQASRAKRMLLDVVTQHQKRALRMAQAGYRQEVQTLSAATYNLPHSPEERRRLFELVVAKQPQYAQMYTTQHRDLKDLTDADVESYLEDLAALGILNDLFGDGKS
jgi:hypothetical protein